MLDMRFVRENPDVVKENIKKKFQDFKLPLVDEVIALDAENRAAITEASELRAQRNQLSKQVGMLMGQAKKDPSKLEDPQAVEGATLYLAVCDDMGNPRKVWCGTFENGKARIGNIPARYVEEIRSIYILDQRLIPLTNAA